MERVTDLPDINPEDVVYRAESGQLIKVRVLEVDIDPIAEPDLARNSIVLQVSASLCDERGKALPDDRLGHLIAWAGRHTGHLQGLAEKARAENRDASVVFDEWVESLRLQHAKEAESFLLLQSMRKSFKRLVPAPAPAEVVEPAPVAPALPAPSLPAPLSEPGSLDA